MINQTVGQQKVLEEIKSYYEYARDSELRSRFMSQAKEDLDLYYGRHWTDKQVKDLAKLDIDPLTINRIEPIINNYISLQIASRRSITFKSNTTVAAHKKVAENLKYMFYTVQQQNHYQHKATTKFKNAVGTGFGCIHFGYDSITEKFFYDYVDFREVLLDPDDRSLRLDESNYICRSYFAAIIALKQRYPKFSEYFDSKITAKVPTSVKFDLWDLKSFDNGDWTNGKSIKIVEVYYKKNVKYYRTKVAFSEDVIDETDGTVRNEQIESYFLTFDKEEAENRKTDTAEVEELNGTQIWKGVYTDNVLLESGPIYGQTPNQKYFPLLPLCLNRNDEGIPYGEIRGLRDLSKTLNMVWSQAVHGLNSRYLIIDGVNQDSTKVEEMLIQMSKKRGIVCVNNAKDAQLFSQENMLQYLFNALRRLDVEFEQRTQVYDELKGDETNATSGVGMKERSNNSARMLLSVINSAYDYMLYSEGQLFIDTIRGIKDFSYSFSYFQNDQTQQINVDDQISLIDFQIYHDTSPVFNSTNEENIAKFQEVINSPNYQLLFAAPEFLQALGFDEHKAMEYSQAFYKAMSGGQGQEQPMQENNV